MYFTFFPAYSLIKEKASLFNKFCSILIYKIQLIFNLKKNKTYT